MPRDAAPRRSRARVILTIGGWCVLGSIAFLAGRRVQAFVSADDRFALVAPRWPGDRAGGVTIEGSIYSKRERILRVFHPDLGRSIFLMPLAERRRRLLAIDWLEDASVSRVWPNHVVVRVTERKPVAFVNIPTHAPGAYPGRTGSRVSLIDAYGVLLEPPPKSRFTFPVLNGVTAEQSEAERRQRVQRMLRLLDDLGGLARDISEVDVSSPESVNVIAQVEGRALELMLGNQNFAQRLRNFLTHYPEIRKRSAAVTAFDLRLDDRITAKE